MSSIESNLENRVFSFRSPEDFIAQDFSPVSYSKSELRQANHPIELYRFNRTYENDLALSLFGITVKNIYPIDRMTTIFAFISYCPSIVIEL